MPDKRLKKLYDDTLLQDVIPFWEKHSPDREFGGIFSSLGRRGELLDTDKSIWVQGRAGWMFSTLYHSLSKKEEWLEIARSCIHFLREHGEDESEKLYFTVTREGAPLRMRRYVFSEAFASIANAAYFSISDEERSRTDALRFFESYILYSFQSGKIPAKSFRESKGLAPLMIAIVTAQELRKHLGDQQIEGASFTEKINGWIEEVYRDFFKEDEEALMEQVGPAGEIQDHFDGRLLNPGHAIEAAWFILREAYIQNDREKLKFGLRILDTMWQRGWDEKFGGILYFRDLKGLPVQEYWQDMKFWWPHNEAMIATLLAWKLTGDSVWRDRHALVSDWSFKYFTDPEYGEWFGYLHRDGSPSVDLKGNMWKSPFHLPRALFTCLKILEIFPEEADVLPMEASAPLAERVQAL